jgi:hypothetical protein
MACALTSDMLIDCKEGMAGLQKAYVIEFANVATITVTAGVITALTKATGKRFYEYQLPRETGELTSDLAGDDKTGTLFFNHSAKIVVNKLTSQVRNELLLLARNRIIVVGLDQNGKYWMVGRQNGLLVSTGKLGTGVAAADRSGADLDFTGVEPEPMIEVETSVGAALITPAA